MMTWKKSMLALTALVALAISMTGCGPDYSTPEGAAAMFLDAQIDGDNEAIRASITNDDVKALDAKDGPKIDLANAPFTEYTIQGVEMEKTKDGEEAAVVNVNATVEGKQEPMKIWCLKEGENWKVALIITTFANMKEGDVKATAS